MVKSILKEADEKMHKTVETVRQELAKIRTGKATTALLDGIKVDYYGTPTALNHIGNVGVADVHTLSVQPYDKGMMEHVIKAIQVANLGLNPSKDGEIIRDENGAIVDWIFRKANQAALEAILEQQSLTSRLSGQA